MSTRRTFLQQGALVAAGMLMKPANIFSRGNYKVSTKDVGLQLYTLREELAKDAKGTIAKVAKLGFTNVETFGADKQGKFWGLDTKELASVLKENNLVTYSGHYALNDFLTRGNGNEDALHAQVEIASQLGQQYLIIPVPPFQLIDKLTADDYKFMADQMNKGGELCKKHNLQLGYHNHFWEFRTFDNGKKGLDIMLENTDKSLVCFELDLFWIEKAGLNPVDYFTKYPGRFPMWHVKDMDKSKTNKVTGGDLDHKPIMDVLKDVKFAEVGTGSIDFKSIFAKADVAGLKHFFVEQDGIYMADKFESVQKSIQYIKQSL
ncbi:sugar phosphate isomerase/epimerase [Danxiaibacter flavus]|uniref:Sugar phosphate isomerase/epimerase n=1 Tax=Danxiaibacter flavus TaxID=3049108 RepID=A0ABV3ZGY7_9BACT|nr:sugar phosphate isomerase/epimerase [Chitinophagaceae bacterium DXS]